MQPEKVDIDHFPDGRMLPGRGTHVEKIVLPVGNINR